MSKINYGHYVANTDLLGPYQRGVLWVQKCCFSCPGCVAKSMQGEGGFWIDSEQMAEFFLNQPEIEGITISGGEPFLQPEALTEMIHFIRRKKDLGVIVYSGLYMKELEKLAERNVHVHDFLKEIDLLIDGRYEIEKDENRKAVGSSNQQIHLLTERYAECVESYYTPEGRKSEIRIFGKQLQLIGVPDKAGVRFWKSIQREKHDDK